MPELAEVEKVRKLVERNSLNKKIISVIAEEDELVFPNIKKQKIESSLKNRVVKKVCRKGKIFWMEMDSTPHISFHLGMTGRMIVKGEDTTFYYKYPDKNNITWPPRFVKLIIEFNDGTKMAYTNTRRLGRVRLYFDNLPQNEAPISKLGIDPFNNMCSLNHFSKLILKRKCPLKAALLNQSFCAGVGNWIADEVCYQSGIYPGSYCNTLNCQQINKIYNSLQLIVKYAVNVDANYHKFPSNWLFHYRWDKAKANNKNKNKTNTNHNCDYLGNPIIYEQIGGRTTAVVIKLQSKDDGCRDFTNSKQLGKKTKRENDSDDDIEMNDKKEVVENKKKKSKKKKSKRSGIKKDVKTKKNSSKINKKKSKRKVRQHTKNNVKDTETHVLTANNILIPVTLLRRSARLAAKRIK